MVYDIPKAKYIYLIMLLFYMVNTLLRIPDSVRHMVFHVGDRVSQKKIVGQLKDGRCLMAEYCSEGFIVGFEMY